MTQISNAHLNTFATQNGVSVPAYDRSRVTCGIMHMSIGGFHRSHQAVYMEQALAQGKTDWGICAIGLMPQDKENIERLQQQDTLYSVLERSANQDHLRIVGSIIEVMHAPSDPAAVLARLADEAIRILSLTITEKGYCYDNDKNLMMDNPSIAHDLRNLDTPKTAIGYIVAGLKGRMDTGKKPFTVMSCDNLPGNGHLTQKLVLQFANAVDQNLASWIETHVCFPNAMVDRITPMTSQATIQTIAHDFGIEDQWPVMCEDFMQWILEDDFCHGEHPYEGTEVQLVAQVDAYEKMKVRLLNGAHSALSYLSYLMGYREVDTAMNDPLVAQFVRHYMDVDVTPTLPNVPGIDLDAYKDKLIERFSNPAISDQVQRLAEDGSQKIPNAILPCIAHQLAHGGSITFLTVAIAGWFRYLTAIDEQGSPIAINDPVADKLVASAQKDTSSPLNLLAIEPIFGPDLINNDTFVTRLREALTAINDNGARAVLMAALG